MGAGFPWQKRKVTMSRSKAQSQRCFFVCVLRVGVEESSKYKEVVEKLSKVVCVCGYGGVGEGRKG